MSRSSYDELHDNYHAIMTTKAGTRYERLAAMVFKALQEQRAVIHDLSLLGESDVSHQIDVQMEVDGQKRRTIIECKDFDISGGKVGLDIVRNFWAVIDDTKADEGIIITCNGFTADAAKYAKAKNVKLAVLRKHEEKDWAGRIRTIVVQLIAVSPANARMGIVVPNDAERDYFMEAAKSLPNPGGMSISDPVWMVKNQERVQINEFLSKHVHNAIPLKGNDTPDKASVRVESEGWKIQIAGHRPITFDSINIEFDIRRDEMESVITSRRVAELLLSGFRGADVIIFGDQLERRKIDPETGIVS